MLPSNELFQNSLNPINAILLSSTTISHHTNNNETSRCCFTECGAFTRSKIHIYISNHRFHFLPTIIHQHDISSSKEQRWVASNVKPRYVLTVLSKFAAFISKSYHMLTSASEQNNSALFVKRAPRHHTLANMTSTCLRQVSINAQHAKHLSIARTTSSSLDAAGLLSSTLCLEQSRGTKIKPLVWLERR